MTDRVRSCEVVIATHLHNPEPAGNLPSRPTGRTCCISSSQPQVASRLQCEKSSPRLGLPKRMRRKRYGRAAREFSRNHSQGRRVPRPRHYFQFEPGFSYGDAIRHVSQARRLVASLPVSALQAAPRSHTQALCSGPQDCTSLYPLGYRLEANQLSVHFSHHATISAGRRTLPGQSRRWVFLGWPVCEVGRAQVPTSLRSSPVPVTERHGQYRHQSSAARDPRAGYVYALFLPFGVGASAGRPTCVQGV